MEKVFEFANKMWEIVFGDDMQVYNDEYYDWEEEYHDIRIEYYVGKPKGIREMKNVTPLYRVDYDLIVSGVFIDGEIIYHQDDLPESIWEEFEANVDMEYYRLFKDKRIQFYGNIVFDYSRQQGINESEEKPSQDKLLIYMLKMLNPDEELYIDFYLSPDKKTTYVVGDEDVLNKKYKGDSWNAPSLTQLVHSAKKHINYQNPEGLTKVVFVKKKNDNKSSLREGKFYRKNYDKLIPSVEYVLNRIFTEDFDWFKGIKIDEIGICSSVVKCIDVHGKLKIDGNWGFAEYRKYNYEKPFHDEVRLGDMTGTKIYGEFKDTLILTLSGLLGFDVKYFTDNLHVELISDEEPTKKSF